MIVKLIHVPTSTPRVTGFNGRRKIQAYYLVEIDGIPKIAGAKEDCISWLKEAGFEACIDCDASGYYPSGNACISCCGSGFVCQGDGIP